MNFTEKQKTGCRELLNQFDYEVILSLSNTVTRKSISVVSRKEAIEAILSFSMSANELLGRQKITRDFLMQYLFSQRLSVSGNSSKQELISRILEYWSGEKISYPAIQSPTREHTHWLRWWLMSPALDKHTRLQTLQTKLSPFTTTSSVITSSMFKFFMQNMCSLRSVDPLLNLFPPSVVMTAKNEEKIEGADLVACRLKRLVSEENLYFNANVTGGVMSQAESTGIVCVLVHGTVHKGDQCLGVFEQKFALLRDPSSENNWKITRVSLKICAKLYY
uniref:NTF2 domain-containing protein n=1 Tax=Octopus bimaculoides TaxID=37653 RepID=A0A0L8HX90_OCTBM